ncbi:hypothetical protein [Paraherbaspirillum soli]|uniref:Uncharacterized protein n=1 Tax=Paraherbaspirillum soli TaxID=631222 RepID=A0ABW0M9I5_9BURK
MSEHRRQKLDIVFELDCEFDVEEIQIGINKLGRLITAGGFSEIQALRMIIGIMRHLHMPMEFIEREKKYSAESFLKLVEKRGTWGRTAEAGGFSFRAGSVPALKHCFISIEEINAGSITSWADWVTPFLTEDGFVQAWVSDVEYDYWQNAKDPLQYEAVGRSFSHLPTKSNGLPPPLEQIEIDTSNNPGRWSLHSGYVEAIGSTMWLGMPFWKYVGETRKDTLLSSDWLDVRSEGNGVIYVVASEHGFFDESTEGIQNNLRTVLYGG